MRASPRRTTPTGSFDDDPGRLLDALETWVPPATDKWSGDRGELALESCRSYVWPWPRSTRRSVIWRVTPTWSSSGRGGRRAGSASRRLSRDDADRLPIEDLALRPSFVEASRATLESVARRLADAGHGDVLVVVGYLDGQRGAAPVVELRAAHRRTRLRSFTAAESWPAAKHHLPNYGVFDEYRYFVPDDALRWYG